MWYITPRLLVPRLHFWAAEVTVEVVGVTEEVTIETAEMAAGVEPRW